MKAQKLLLAVVLLVGLFGCSQAPDGGSVESITPTFSPPEEASPTPVPSVTPEVGQTPVVPATQPPPTSLPNPGAAPADFSPILYGGKQFDSEFFVLLGGVSGNGWLAPETSAARFSSEATYALHSMQHANQYFVWGQSLEYSPACGIYTVRSNAGLTESGFVATLDGRPVTKRPVTVPPAGEAYYQRIVYAWLRSEGVPDPQPGVLQAWQVDIEDDQDDEIFISATHLDESQHTTKAGDYSVILMLQADEDTAHTKLIVGDVYRSEEPEITFPRTYSMANFIDLDGDGTLEVIVGIQGWEQFGAAVYQVHGLEVIESLRAEC